MELKVNSKELDVCLNHLRKIIPNKNSIPALKNFLFKVSNDHMSISGADNEVLLEIQFSCQSDMEMSFMVPAIHFLPLVCGLSDQELRLEINDQCISVYHENGHFLIPYEKDTALFPAPHVKSDNVVINTMPIECFSRSHALLRPFIEKPDELVNPIFSSVYFEFSNEGLCVVGTNGKCLALREIPLENTHPTNFMLSAKAVALFEILSDLTADTVLKITSDDNFVFIETETVKLSVLKASGKFPNFRSVIPNSYSYRADVDRRSLSKFLKRVESICGKHVIATHFSEKGLKLTAEDLDVGIHSEDTLDCDYEGNDFTIGLNNVMFNNAVKVLSSDKIRLDMVSLDMPVKICPVNEDKSFKDLVIVSPMVF